MDWNLVGKVLERVLHMWPYVLFAVVIIVSIFGGIDAYRNSKYFKTPWEKREAKEAKKRAREEAREQKAFWAGKKTEN